MTLHSDWLISDPLKTVSGLWSVFFPIRNGIIDAVFFTSKLKTLK